MKVYVLSSVNLDCGEYMSKTVWGVFKSKEEVDKYIKDNDICDNEHDVEVDIFNIE